LIVTAVCVVQAAVSTIEAILIKSRHITASHVAHSTEVTATAAIKVTATVKVTTATTVEVII
jgi:hypothetical protein